MRSSITHVYHHFESKPCERCGYISNSGYVDKVGLYEHIIHTVQESSVLVDRLVKSKKVKVDTTDNPK